MSALGDAWAGPDARPGAGPERGRERAVRSVLGAVLVAWLALWGWLLMAACSEVGSVQAGFRVNRVATVWLTNEPHQPGIRAGMRPGDVIVAVDGRPVASGPDVRRLARAAGGGGSVGYTLDRDGKRHHVEVPATRLDWVGFLRSFGVRFLLPLGMAVIGAAALWLRPENEAARANALFCLGWAAYGLLDIDFEWTYLVHPAWYYASVMLYGAAALAMALCFPQPLPGPLGRKWVMRAPYVLGLLGLSPVLGALAAWGVSPQAIDVGEWIGTLWANGVLLVGFGVLLSRWRHTADARARAQLQVLVLGIAGAFLPAALLGNLPPLVGLPPAPLAVTALTTLLFGLFPAAVTYAVVRHGMFDIDVIIKRTTTYAVVTFGLAGGYFALAAGVRAAAAGLGLAHATEWENVLVTAVIAVAFVPLRDAVRAGVDRLFFVTPYDFRQVVANITERAQATLDLEGLQRLFLSEIDQALKPRFVYILTRDEEGGGMSASGAAVWGDAPVPELRVRPDDALLARAGDSAEVGYVPGSGQTGPLSTLAALGPHHRVPLQVGEEVVGLVVLGPRLSGLEYRNEDRELLAATRLPLAAAIKTAGLVASRLFQDRIEQDLRRAREVQSAMLPRELPRLSGVDFAALSVPCYEASGDYYDVLPLPDGRVALAIADVAGKGIAAALATAMLKSCLYNQTRLEPDVAPTLTALNRLLWTVSRHSTAKSFTTCAYAVLDPEALTLRFACAGHFPPLVWRAAERVVVEPEAQGGFPLGVREATRYAVHDIDLAPGDVLVFYTDGITEAQSPALGDEQFETERLSAVLAAHAGDTAEGIKQAIAAAVRGFVGDGPSTDDLTLLVVRMAPV